MELRIEQQVRGVRIITGQEAQQRRMHLGRLAEVAQAYGFEELILPAIEPSSLYVDKAGPEVLGQMYVFRDRKGRELCLRPEGTATVQAIAREHWKGQEKRVWYFERCYRYERPQAGRYREFFQFGVEWLNPRTDAPREVLIEMAGHMLKGTDAVLSDGVKRGLSYYTGDGFEFVCEKLGAQKQVCGGGPYEGGIGFAIGFDRMMLALNAS
jgi:histidyl-tRNA synthetase